MNASRFGGVLNRGPDVGFRCVECGGRVAQRDDDELACGACSRAYPVVGGVVRMLPRRLVEDAASVVAKSGSPSDAAKLRTGASFAYEWERFGRLRPDWRRNFLDYMRPRAASWFEGKRVLDVGTGSGRHAREAAELGARVVAVDVGAAIDVARANLPPEVVTVQADAEALPFEPEGFDLVMSIGVLHHLPDPRRALAGLVSYARRGGVVHVYLYWQPPVALHRAILRGVSLARRLTIRLPHPVLHALCYPLSALLYVAIVAPYSLLRRRRAFEQVARLFPLKAYADYPFGVLVNDQFDRFSAPIEHRFTRDEVTAMMRDAGLVDITVLSHHGWIADGRRPAGAEAGRP